MQNTQLKFDNIDDGIDFNDLLFVIEKFGNPIGAIPAPLSTFKEGKHKGKEKINPHVSRFYFGNEKFVDIVHVKPVYYLNHEEKWRPMREIASYHGNKNIHLKEDWADRMDGRYLSWLLKRAEHLKGNVKIPSPYSKGLISITEQLGVLGKATIHFTTDTFYPDPSPETTSVDGRSQNFSGSGVWATMHAATDGTSADDSSAAMYFQVYHRSGSNLGIDRLFFLFDTSSLPDGATISAATLSVYFTQKNDQEADAQSYFNVVQSSPASNTALTTADFDQCGAVTNPTKGASDLAYSSLPAVNNYADFALNATGIGWISKTGITKLGVREGHDIEDVDPNAGGDGVYLYIYCAETSGTATDPKLVVTYTSSVASTLTATQQSYTLTGQASILKHAAKIIPTYASIVLTGQNALLALGQRISMAYGSFVLAGQDISFFIGKLLSATYGNFTVTGQDANLKIMISFIASQASYVVTGISATLTAAIRYTWTLTASTGSFVLTGIQALLKLRGWVFDTKKTNTWDIEDIN